MQLVVREQNQGPYLTQVLNYAKAQQAIDETQLQLIKSKAVLMSLKFADKFYNKYKMHLLEQAAHDIIGVVSLGLAELSDHDLSRGWQLLISPEGVVKPFQKGWHMLSAVSSNMPNRKSLYGEVDEQLLQDISSPPDAEEWAGWQLYQQALLEANRRNAIVMLKKQFFYHTQLDPFEHFSPEALLAEVVLYRVICNGGKVKQDLKQRIRQQELQPHWFELSYLQQQMDMALAELPAGIAQAIQPDLGQNFAAALLKTLNFARSYQKLAQDNASPEKLDAFEHKQGMQNPLLGWPQYIEM